ncbi:MAG TPA: hypothetical protein VK306_08765 [Acidimicrobiales bacterium]|nr:hypothetical protein [Acidimicrobiales bacterium]
MTTVANPLTARILAAQLGAEGVVWQLRGADDLYPVGPVELLVDETDLEVAREVLTAVTADGPDDDDPAAPDDAGAPGDPFTAGAGAGAAPPIGLVFRAGAHGVGEPDGEPDDEEELPALTPIDARGLVAARRRRARRLRWTATALALLLVAQALRYLVALVF